MEAIEETSGIMFLVVDGIDDPAITRVQGTGFTVHVCQIGVRDLPEAVPLSSPTASSDQDEKLPYLFLEGAFPFILRHVTLRAHVFQQFHVSSSLIDGTGSLRRTLLHAMRHDHLEAKRTPASFSLNEGTRPGHSSQLHGAKRHSHSMVAGGLDVTSKTTRLTSATEFVIRVEIRASTS